MKISRRPSWSSFGLSFSSIVSPINKENEDETTDVKPMTEVRSGTPTSRQTDRREGVGTRVTEDHCDEGGE